MKKLFAALMLVISANVMAAPEMGTDYDETQRVIPTNHAEKIEVMELFWYGCPHCYHMEPALNAWLKKLPKDVYFRRVPGLPRPDWAPMAKAFYAMETLGVSKELHTKLFEAIHKNRALRPDNEAAAIAWVTKASGKDKKEVEAAFNSFSSNTKLNRAAQIFKSSGATGVPALIVDGKYVTGSSMAGGNQAALKVVDYLIKKARAEKKASK